jgi:hypothetical protein
LPAKRLSDAQSFIPAAAIAEESAGVADRELASLFAAGYGCHTD